MAFSAAIRRWERVTRRLPGQPAPLSERENYIWTGTARYYDFDEEIVIRPPLTESGRLLEGWHPAARSESGELLPEPWPWTRE